MRVTFRWWATPLCFASNLLVGLGGDPARHERVLAFIERRGVILS